ncbi:MAG: DUF1761 domain-containing protein [Calditrichaeota bacterium]|jgi:hypothetical protein|nr:DUF1761 domain-containing protein [Calditrichota bacterium]MBT7618489.1 DUF1761 domain-containing protein [Calditrichota bacterium]MBT7787257.1 DUF1761 domain-containing protein [Calditrichota bacterium]
MYVPEINYWAVLVSAVVFFLIGAMWYGPLLGKAWLKAMGWTRESLEASIGKTTMAKSFIIMFVSSLIMSYVTAHMVSFMSVVYPEIGMVQVGLSCAFWLWLGYVLSYILTAPAFERRPWSYVFINGGYWLIGMIAAGLILGYWR